MSDSFLVPAFRKVVGLAVNAHVLSEARSKEILLKFMLAVGALGDFAVRKDRWLQRGRVQLALGNLDPLHFAMMTSALVSRHQHSDQDRKRYLDGAIDLALAGNISQIFIANPMTLNSPEYARIRAAFYKDGLTGAKIESFLVDIEKGTDGRISHKEMHEAFVLYNTRKPFEDSARSGALNRSKSSKHAFEHTVLLPIIKELVSQNVLSEEQVTLILSLNFHAKETRRFNNGPAVMHPFSVYKVVSARAVEFGFKPKDVRLMKLAALIHDIGEKTKFVMAEHLNDITSRDLRDLANLVHKENHEHYFDDYIGKKCRFSRMAAFIKLCDIWHNSLDAENGGLSFKQAYAYRIAANYLRYVIGCKATPMSVDDFVVSRGICSREEFTIIKDYTHYNHKVEVSEVVGKIPVLRNLLPTFTIFQQSSKPVTYDYAHLLRKEDTPVHHRPDV
jgi:hypothetical protein